MIASRVVEVSNSMITSTRGGCRIAQGDGQEM